jgi:hypothetical protein
VTYNSGLKTLLLECDTGYSSGNCTPMFIAALFTIANYGNSQDAPPLTNGLWYLYTMELYAAMKKNEMLSFAAK